MTRLARPIPLLLLSACAWFEGAKDTVEGLVEPVVAVGVFAVADPPAAGTALDPEELGLVDGVGITLFLADARSVSDLGNAPVSGLDVRLDACGDDVALTESADGTYTWTDAASGCEGPFEATAGDPVPLTVVATPPSSASLDVPLTWSAGDDLVLDLSDAGWGSAVVALVDAATGDVLYDTRPTSITDWYEVLTNRQDLGAVTIPGGAFRDDTPHALAVTGLARTPNRELDEVNTALSVVAGGRVQTYGILVGETGLDTA